MLTSGRPLVIYVALPNLACFFYFVRDQFFRVAVLLQGKTLNDMSIQLYIYLYIYLYIELYIYLHIYLYMTCRYNCTYIYTYIYIHISIYLYTELLVKLISGRPFVIYVTLPHLVYFFYQNRFKTATEGKKKPCCGPIDGQNCETPS